jgi:hypothetical protein
MLTGSALSSPAIIITCCPFVGGILYRCPVGGLWSAPLTGSTAPARRQDPSSLGGFSPSSPGGGVRIQAPGPTVPQAPDALAASWPSTIVNETGRIVICTTDCACPPIPPTLESRCGVVSILDFLLLCGARDTTHAHTSAQTSRDGAVRALARNAALIQRYQNAGPYENVLVVPLPVDLCPQIDAEVAIRMAGYIPSSDVDLLRERLRRMPNHAIDLRGYKSYTWKPAAEALLCLVTASGRGLYQDYVLPVFERRPSPGSDVEMAVRFQAIGTVLSILADSVSRDELERALGISHPELCASMGGSQELLDTVLSHIV